jgi:hypothetical protein
VSFGTDLLDIFFHTPMNLVFPRIALKTLPAMFGIALLGAVVGGIYGVFHDLVTYSISSEYFTRLKFYQFAYADFGFPPRLFAAEIGFIATGAVGLGAGWFLARTALPVWPFGIAIKKIFLSFLLIIGIAAIAGVAGYWIGLRYTTNDSNWSELCSSIGVLDIRSFVHVAYIHYASYIGGLLGLILAILRLRYLREQSH